MLNIIIALYKWSMTLGAEAEPFLYNNKDYFNRRPHTGGGGGEG